VLVTSGVLDLMIRHDFAGTASAPVHLLVVPPFPQSLRTPKALRRNNEDRLIILGTIGDES